MMADFLNLLISPLWTLQQHLWRLGKCWSCFSMWSNGKAALLGYHSGNDLWPELQFDLYWYELFCMCDTGSQSAALRLVFHRGPETHSLSSSDTNHFEARVTQGCNVTLIYHTWDEIKSENPKSPKHFLGVRFKGARVPLRLLDFTEARTLSSMKRERRRPQGTVGLRDWGGKLLVGGTKETRGEKMYEKKEMYTQWCN